MSTLILNCLFLFSLFEWSVPFLCWMAVTILLLASILFYFVPLRYVIFVWGKNGAACVWTVLHCLYVSGCDNKTASVFIRAEHLLKPRQGFPISKFVSENSLYVYTGTK